MGVETNVHQGYGIGILTKNLTEETIKMLEENEIPICDCYDNKDWFFIPLNIDDNCLDIARGIQYNSKTTNNTIPSSLIPLFLDDSGKPTFSSSIEEEQSFAIQLLHSKYHDQKDYKKLKEILTNRESWIPGKYLVIYYS